MGNNFGKIFRLTTFGESHGKAIGGIIDGCPANKEIDLSKVQLDLDKRRPGQSKIVTQRKESDKVEFLSGIFDGKAVRKDGDTIGGIVSCVIKNVPVGIGEPVFDKLHAELGKAMLSINAVKGFEFGSGFRGVEMRGSEHNDQYKSDESTKTNNSGGIQGGISNGMEIYFNVAFKPVATIMKDQKTIDKAGKETNISGKGRHDPCVVPRAVPIVESMAALVILDMILINNSKNL